MKHFDSVTVTLKLNHTCLKTATKVWFSVVFGKHGFCVNFPVDFCWYAGCEHFVVANRNKRHFCKHLKRNCLFNITTDLPNLSFLFGSLDLSVLSGQVKFFFFFT